MRQTQEPRRAFFTCNEEQSVLLVPFTDVLLVEECQQSLLTGGIQAGPP